MTMMLSLQSLQTRGFTALTTMGKGFPVAPVLQRQLGLHKWSHAEEYVRENYANRPGRYIVSRVAGCMFCIDVDSSRNLTHRVVPDNIPTADAVDLTT